MGQEKNVNVVGSGAVVSLSVVQNCADQIWSAASAALATAVVDY